MYEGWVSNGKCCPVDSNLLASSPDTRARLVSRSQRPEGS